MKIASEKNPSRDLWIGISDVDGMILNRYEDACYRNNRSDGEWSKEFCLSEVE
jgi:hypothetical protein